MQLTLLYSFVVRSFIAFITVFAFFTQPVLAETHVFNSVTIEVNGARVWVPSTFIVKKGDTVQFQLSTKVSAPNNVHGFAIDAFQIHEAVDEKGKTIKFTANKAGIFPIRCHLHPAHIGGQLVVLK